MCLHSTHSSTVSGTSSNSCGINGNDAPDLMTSIQGEVKPLTHFLQDVRAEKAEVVHTAEIRQDALETMHRQLDNGTQGEMDTKIWKEMRLTNLIERIQQLQCELTVLREQHEKGRQRYQQENLNLRKQVNQLRSNEERLKARIRQLESASNQQPIASTRTGRCSLRHSFDFNIKPYSRASSVASSVGSLRASSNCSRQSRTSTVSASRRPSPGVPPGYRRGGGGALIPITPCENAPFSSLSVPGKSFPSCQSRSRYGSAACSLPILRTSWRSNASSRSRGLSKGSTTSSRRSHSSTARSVNNRRRTDITAVPFRTSFKNEGHTSPCLSSASSSSSVRRLPPHLPQASGRPVLLKRRGRDIQVSPSSTEATSGGLHRCSLSASPSRRIHTKEGRGREAEARGEPGAVRRTRSPIVATNRWRSTSSRGSTRSSPMRLLGDTVNASPRKILPYQSPVSIRSGCHLSYGRRNYVPLRRGCRVPAQCTSTGDKETLQHVEYGMSNESIFSASGNSVGHLPSKIMASSERFVPSEVDDRQQTTWDAPDRLPSSFVRTMTTRPLTCRAGQQTEPLVKEMYEDFNHIGPEAVEATAPAGRDAGTGFQDPIAVSSTSMTSAVTPVGRIGVEVASTHFSELAVAAEDNHISFTEVADLPSRENKSNDSFYNATVSAPKREGASSRSFTASSLTSTIVPISSTATAAFAQTASSTVRNNSHSTSSAETDSAVGFTRGIASPTPQNRLHTVTGVSPRPMAATVSTLNKGPSSSVQSSIQAEQKKSTVSSRDELATSSSSLPPSSDCTLPMVRQFGNLDVALGILLRTPRSSSSSTFSKKEGASANSSSTFSSGRSLTKPTLSLSKTLGARPAVSLASSASSLNYEDDGGVSVVSESPTHSRSSVIECSDIDARLSALQQFLKNTKDGFKA